MTDTHTAEAATMLTVPLYRLAHSRTGDKGNRSNLSVIAWHPALWDVLVQQVTEEAVARHFAARQPSRVARYLLPDLAGPLPPADLKLREDLRTRLGWGHVFQLQLLDETARRAVLRQEADARGVFLGDDVMDYMLKRFSRDLGSLMQLLDMLDGFALRNKRAITIPLLNTMLETE